MENIVQNKWTEVFAQLAGKINNLDIPAEEDVQQIEQIISMLDRLEELIARIESSVSLKSRLDAKMEDLVTRIGLLAQMPSEGLPAQKSSAFSLEQTLPKILHQARVAGKVLETLASGLQSSLEPLGQALLKDVKAGTVKEGSTGESEAANTGGTKEQLDLQPILQPLGTLVQNLVEEKVRRMRRGESKVKDKHDASGQAPGAELVPAEHVE